MFGIGMPEMLLILAIALIVIGPKKLPDLAKYLGRAIGEFRKAASDFKESIDIDSSIGEVKNQFDDINDNIRNATNLTTDMKTALKSELTDSKDGEPAAEPIPSEPAKSGDDKDRDAPGMKRNTGLNNGQ